MERCGCLLGRSSLRHKSELSGVIDMIEVVSTPRKTLFEPGHEAEWAELNREKREYHQRTARAMTPSERMGRTSSSFSHL